jgi:hypothetical protein
MNQDEVSTPKEIEVQGEESCDCEVRPVHRPTMEEFEAESERLAADFMKRAKLALKGW